jgi:hypothetical protein
MQGNAQLQRHYYPIVLKKLVVQRRKDEILFRHATYNCNFIFLI